ncbi:ATP-binding protein [Streptococcus cameli]
MEHLLKERKKQYQMEKDAVQHINHKVHDLKNQVLALQNMEESKKGEYYQDILHSISHYDQVFNLENESLNTLLTQKHHQCQLKGIQLTHMIDGEALHFLSLLDVYTILGNALDNAIDCVQDYEDPADRQISLHIKQHKQFVVMEVLNRFLDTIELDPESQLPKSTKNDHHYHGFGLKSIQTTLEKYNGWLSIHTENQTFLLTMMIPSTHQKETPQ